MSKTANLVTITLNPAIDLACTVPEFAIGQVNRAVISRTDAGGCQLGSRCFATILVSPSGVFQSIRPMLTG